MVNDQGAERGDGVPVVVGVDIAPPVERIATLWRAIEGRSRHSFFLSWHWVGTWLRESGVAPILLHATRGGIPVGAAILCRPESAGTSGLVPALHLTSTGDSGFDAPFIEYNGFLVSIDGPAAITDAMAASLVALPAFPLGKDKAAAWGRLGLPGVDGGMRSLLTRSGLSSRLLAELPSPFIDLAGIRRGGVAYLDTRSRNTRQQIRRSMRLFEAEGKLEMTPATSLADAMATFTELKMLHQHRWAARGKRGAFAEPFFERFHRALITESWSSGAIDLLRLRAGNSTIGCLYNFIHQGRAYAYQSGFAVYGDPRFKPGLVSHALAIERYLATDLERYLFLAGESRYKTSLATDSDTLLWLEATRPGAAGLVSAAAEAPRHLLGALGRQIGRIRRLA